MRRAAADRTASPQRRRAISTTCPSPAAICAKIDTRTGAATVIEPPTPRQGARRVWSDSKGRLWISEWLSGQVSMYDPANTQWKAWKPPERSQMYSVYVDERDKVWLTEWSTNAILRFDPETEKFERFPSDRPNAQVRQMLGRPAKRGAPNRAPTGWW